MTRCVTCDTLVRILFGVAWKLFTSTFVHAFAIALAGFWARPDIQTTAPSAAGVVSPMCSPSLRCHALWPGRCGVFAGLRENFEVGGH